MRSADFSDAELLNGLISKDERILRAYYSLYFQSIRRYVLSNNGREEDAKDLFQDVLLALFQKVRKGQFTLTCALGTYLYSVSRFLWFKELGRQKRISYQSVDHEDFMDVDADIVSVNEKNERLLFYRKYFEKLSENCRKVLTLFAEGYSIAEITKIMGFKSEQHTKNRKYRCKMSLINGVKALYDDNSIDNGKNTDY
jgi:RNA polymerase sigma factor (sigma-70 family)